MKTLKEILDSTLPSTVLVLICGLALLIFAFDGKGTEKELLTVIAMLLIAIWGKEKK